MSSKIIAAFAVITLVSACAGYLGGPPPQPAMSKAYSHSIGFTGVDGEPF